MCSDQFKQADVPKKLIYVIVLKDQYLKEQLWIERTQRRNTGIKMYYSSGITLLTYSPSLPPCLSVSQISADQTAVWQKPVTISSTVILMMQFLSFSPQSSKLTITWDCHTLLVLHKTQTKKDTATLSQTTNPKATSHNSLFPLSATFLQRLFKVLLAKHWKCLSKEISNV